jgi:hypothetical protein
MKAFVQLFSASFSRWLFPIFFNEKKGVQFLIPIPVLKKMINKNHIILILMICSVMYQGKVSARNIEKYKPVATFTSNTNAQKLLRPMAFESLITNLYANVNNVYNLADGNMVIYDDAYSNAVDGADARKLTNWGENFGLVRDNITLAVEKRKVMRALDTVFYAMSNLRSISYKLEIQATNLNHPGMVGFLEDVFLGTRVSLSLTETTRYLFNVTSTAASSSRSRFRAIFFTVSSSTLPVSFSSISAKKSQNTTTINWKVSNQINIEGYKVQSSTNGINFTTVGNVSAISNGDLAASYQWTDNEIATRTKYYRVVSVGIAGENKYSPIVVINGTKNITSFNILSNPVLGTDVKVLFSNKEKGDYAVRVFNSVGKLIFSNKTVHAEGTSTYTYGLPGNILKGNYFVEIADEQNTRQVLPIVIPN